MSLRIVEKYSQAEKSLINELLNDDDLTFEEKTQQFALLASGFVGALSGQLAEQYRRNGYPALTEKEFYAVALDWLKQVLVRPS